MYDLKKIIFKNTVKRLVKKKNRNLAFKMTG